MRIFINIFIVVHILLMAAWLFPVGMPLRAIRTVFSRYIIFLGFDQNYSMFAPGVRKTNRYFIALITFKDLSTAMWLYPRIERMNIVEAMRKERYRKFANDNIVTPSFKIFLPDFARYIARLHLCENNKPDLVSIYLAETRIPKPGQRLERTSPPEEPSCHLVNIFTYQVEDKDLN